METIRWLGKAARENWNVSMVTALVIIYADLGGRDDATWTHRYFVAAIMAALTLLSVAISSVFVEIIHLAVVWISRCIVRDADRRRDA